LIEGIWTVESNDNDDDDDDNDHDDRKGMLVLFLYPVWVGGDRTMVLFRFFFECVGNNEQTNKK
jgi:hypothetical protein